MLNPPIKVYWHNPAPIFTARVNMPGTITYPIQDITFDGVTVGAFGDIEDDMFFTLGSAENLDDYGRGRVRAAATSTVLKVGRSSQGFEDGQLNVVDNAYISVYPDFRVHAKIPVIGGDYNEYKDADIAVGDNTENPPPVANMGPDFAQRIDASTGKIRVTLSSSASFAVADGATIASVAWDVKDGTILFGGTAADASIVVEFEAGVRYVSLTVTDSNDKSHITRRLILADDPDDSLCVAGMQFLGLTRGKQGSAARLRTLIDLPRADFPDGAKVLVWEDRDPAIYGTPDPTSRENMRFIGWHQGEQGSSRTLETHLQRETTLTCVDVAGRMDKLPGFDQRVEVPTEEDLVETGMNWGFMPAANMDMFMCYLIHWHSTAASVADFTPSGTWDEYPFVIFNAEGDTLYNQLQRQANRLVPDYNFTSTRFGQLSVVPDPCLQNPDDRTAVTQTISNADWSEIDYGYERHPRVHTLRGSALVVQTEWIIGDEDAREVLPPFFSKAPGTAPGQGGRESTLGERLAKSQADLNDCVGHHYARLNARYGPVTVTLNSNTSPWSIDPAAHTWVLLGVSADTAPQRGLEDGSARYLPKEVSIDYAYSEEGTTWRARATLERETVGLPALTEVSKPALPVGEQPTPPIPPPDFGLIEGQELVAGIGEFELYRTADFQTVSGSGGPTWTAHNLTTDETILSWVVDPFSPGYLTGTGAINGWVVTAENIWRVTDIFGTVGCTILYSFFVPLGGSSVPSQQWRTIQASFGTYFADGSNPWLMVVSHYQDEAGHTGTWALRSVNGGASWAAEVQISEFYDDGASTDTRPIAVYLSPKTPGLAYATAFITTDDPPQASGFVSTDWGFTWTQMVSDFVEDPAEPLPRWAVYDDNAATITLGALAGSASLTSYISDSDGGGAEEVDQYLWLALPPDTVRVEFAGTWHCVYSEPVPSFGTVSGNMSIQDATQTTLVTDFVFTAPATSNDSTFGSFTGTVTLVSGTDWPVNTGNVMSSVNSAALRFRCRSSVSSFNPNLVACTTTFRVRVTEIELDDATIYEPPQAVGVIDPNHRLAGDMHVPWISNDTENLIYHGYADMSTVRQFRLKRVNVDDTISDISPSDSGIQFGVNHYGFAIRAYDSDRAFMLAGVTGNDNNPNSSSDLQAVYISSNNGDTWVEVVAPATGTEPYGAAFAGDSELILFLWGPSEYMGYSSDFGATVDSRAGNLAALSATRLVGIAGGPTP